jgi:glutamyl-tRNA reductase
MRILCTGLNHTTAPVAIREKLAFSSIATVGALGSLRTAYPQSEFLLLSTCNRTELYVIRPLHEKPYPEDLHRWLAETQSVALEEFESALYTYGDDDAIEHLFCVTAGLDSMVPGEDQIVAQIRTALQLACEQDAAGVDLRELFDKALHIGRIVRTETGIAEGKVSVASVAIDAIGHVFASLTGKTVLSIGAGKMNEIVLQQIRALLPEALLVTNRTAARGRELADACGGLFRPLHELPALLQSADVVMTSTGSRAPIITTEALRQAQAARNDRPLLLIDLAVPRDVEAAAVKIPNIFLYNLDDLEAVVAQTLSNRKAHITAARKIVQNHLKAFSHSAHAAHITPTIEALYQRLESIINIELEQATNKLETHDDAAEDLEIIQRALHRALRKFVHPAANYLRSNARSAANHAATLRKLFQLTPDDNDPTDAG